MVKKRHQNTVQWTIEFLRFDDVCIILGRDLKLSL